MGIVCMFLTKTRESFRDEGSTLVALEMLGALVEQGFKADSSSFSSAAIGAKPPSKTCFTSPAPIACKTPKDIPTRRMPGSWRPFLQATIPIW
jgi:hypothetical protein